MLLQSWALMGRHIPFCLWSRFVDDDKKSRVAAKIVSYLPKFDVEAVMKGEVPPPPIPPCTNTSKPEFPVLSSKKELWDYVTSESLIIFSRVVTNWTWLYKPPSVWPDDEDYQSARIFVRGIVTTNTVAERMCALAKRYRVKFFHYLSSALNK